MTTSFTTSPTRAALSADARALVALYDERRALTKAMAEADRPTGAMVDEIFAKGDALDAACEAFRKRYYPRKDHVIVAGRTVMACSKTRRSVTTVYDANEVG